MHILLAKSYACHGIHSMCKVWEVLFPLLLLCQEQQVSVAILYLPPGRWGVCLDYNLPVMAWAPCFDCNLG